MSSTVITAAICTRLPIRSKRGRWPLAAIRARRTSQICELVDPSQWPGYSNAAGSVGPVPSSNAGDSAMNKRVWFTFCLVLITAAPVVAANLAMKVGTPDVKSAGPLAFGPNGMLFVGDPLGAAVFAIDTRDAVGAEDANFPLEGIDAKIAALLGTTADDILINDLAVNPASNTVYLSISRGRGPDAIPVIVQVDSKGNLKQFTLENVPFAKAELANAPENRESGEGRRRGNQRLESITDLTFRDGHLFVAGLSNEEFSSKLRSIEFPFQSGSQDTSIEIFHGSHGRYETRSPVRTFAFYEIGGVPHLLAAYTCTPLVKIPLEQLKPGEKVMGTTVAELGNRNRPLDMVVYQKDGQDYVLMANSARGLMKISLKDVSSTTPITEPVRDKAGLGYDTIENATGVVQLDRLDDANAVVLVKANGGGQNLSTMALP